MTLRLEITSPDGLPRQVLLEPGRTRHVASGSEQYRLAGDPGEVPRSVSVRRVSNSLVVTGLPGERELEISNFFGACTPGRDCTLSLQVDGAAPALVTNEMTPITALSDGSFLLYGSSSEQLSALPVAAPTTDSSLTPGTMAAGLAGLVGLGLAAAVGGGGGGGDTVSTAGGPTAVLPATFTAPPDAGAGSGTATNPGAAPAPAPGGTATPAPVPDSPLVTITDDSAGTTGRPVTFTFRMSEPVTGFTADDVVVTGGTRGALVALPDGQSYTMTVTPTAGVQSGTISVEVPAGAVAGAGGTPSAVAARATQAFDTQTPVLTVTDATPGVAAAGPVTFTFALSEPVSGFTAEDVTVTGGTRGALTALAGGLGYTMAVTPQAGVQAGTLVVDVPAAAFTDAVGNPLAVAGRATQSFDSAAPTVTITDDAATPVNRPVAFRFVFSEPVSGFTADDLTVTGGTPGALRADGDGRGFTMAVTPAVGVTGEIGVTVRAAAVTDAAGNPNPASPTATQAFDTQAPAQQLASFTVADDVLPRRGNLVLGEFSNDTRPLVTLTLDTLLVGGDTLALQRDGRVVAAIDTGRTLNFTDGPLAAGGSTYTYTASINDLAGNVVALDLNGPASGQAFFFSVL